jgi:UDP-glucuronate decarboxylase
VNWRKKFSSLPGRPRTLSFVDLPLDDPRQRKPDITLAREKLGWTPVVQLEEGLRKTISYFDNLLKK